MSEPSDGGFRATINHATTLLSGAAQLGAVFVHPEQVVQAIKDFVFSTAEAARSFAITTMGSSATFAFLLYLLRRLWNAGYAAEAIGAVCHWIWYPAAFARDLTTIGSSFPLAGNELGAWGRIIYSLVHATHGAQVVYGMRVLFGVAMDFIPRQRREQIAGQLREMSARGVLKAAITSVGRGALSVYHAIREDRMRKRLTMERRAADRLESVAMSVMSRVAPSDLQPYWIQRFLAEWLQVNAAVVQYCTAFRMQDTDTVDMAVGASLAWVSLLTLHFLPLSRGEAPQEMTMDSIISVMGMETRVSDLKQLVHDIPLLLVNYQLRDAYTDAVDRKPFEVVFRNLIRAGRRLVFALNTANTDYMYTTEKPINPLASGCVTRLRNLIRPLYRRHLEIPAADGFPLVDALMVLLGRERDVYLRVGDNGPILPLAHEGVMLRDIHLNCVRNTPHYDFEFDVDAFNTDRAHRLRPIESLLRLLAFETIPFENITRHTVLRISDGMLSDAPDTAQYSVVGDFKLDENEELAACVALVYYAQRVHTARELNQSTPPYLARLIDGRLDVELKSFNQFWKKPRTKLSKIGNDLVLHLDTLRKLQDAAFPNHVVRLFRIMHDIVLLQNAESDVPKPLSGAAFTASVVTWANVTTNREVLNLETPVSSRPIRGMWHNQLFRLDFTDGILGHMREDPASTRLNDQFVDAYAADVRQQTEKAIARWSRAGDVTRDAEVYALCLLSVLRLMESMAKDALRFDAVNIVNLFEVETSDRIKRAVDAVAVLASSKDVHVDTDDEDEAAAAAPTEAIRGVDDMVTDDGAGAVPRSGVRQRSMMTMSDLSDRGTDVPRAQVVRVEIGLEPGLRARMQPQRDGESDGQTKQQTQSQGRRKR